MKLTSLILTCYLFVLCVKLSTVQAQTADCQPPFCKDCFPWCPGSKPLCRPDGPIERICRETCNACAATSNECLAAGCEQNCEIMADNVVKCSCQEGYRLVDGKSCVDIDECAEDTTLCLDQVNNTLCRNEPGRYSCSVCQTRENLWSYYEQPTCCKLNNDLPRCGKSFSNNGRVVNGTLSKIGFWPWMAYIVIQGAGAGGRAGLCGGSLISDRWVVSAAHCYETIKSPDDYGNIQVGLGILQTIDNNNVHQQQFRVIELVQHEAFNFPENDISLLRLHRRATLGRFVNVVCLPNGETPKTDELCFATGYGALAFGGAAAEGLQEVDLPIVDIDECAEVYRGQSSQVNPKTMLCAGNRQGTKDTCQGDSGGPLVCQRCNNCDWYLAGITSFGRGCATPGFYGVYTSVVYHEDWISSVTSLSISKGTCIKPSWTDWGAWTECPVTCGGGEQQRIRFCQNGVKGDPDCLGEDFGTLMCNINACDSTTWGQWENYGECSVSCGSGTQTRSRGCLTSEIGDPECPTEDSIQESNCNNGMCPTFGQWSTWSQCSKSCETGMTTGERTCDAPIGGDCVGINTRQRPCNSQPCPVWGLFGTYGACDKTCGTGQQQRSRECINGEPGQIGCVGREFVNRACNEQLCPVWDNWSTWTDCSTTCGPGTQTGSRVCLNGERGDIGCMGSLRRSTSCNVQACPGQWSEWGECSVSCRQGQQTRTRTSSSGNMDQTRDCTVNARCPRLEEWSAWSECTESCGTGEQSARRQCSNGNFGDDGCTGPRMRTRVCNTFDCPTWSIFGPYLECSASCGGGTRMRSRTCQGGQPEGIGCIGSATNIGNCNTHPCPTWGTWGAFGQCDVTCGEGMQTSMRVCINGVVGDDGCVGNDDRRRGCNSEICPVFSDWTEFGDCSVSCDGGMRERTRTCPQEGLCPADGYGTSLTDSEECNIEICRGVWGDWTAVEPCSETCGDGSLREERTCNGGIAGGPGCPGVGNRVVNCNLGVCPTWAEWSNFGDCSTTCDEGSQERTRVCVGGTTCVGDDTNTQTCNVGNCETAPGDECAGKVDIIARETCLSYRTQAFCTNRNFMTFVLANCDLTCCERVRCEPGTVDLSTFCAFFLQSQPQLCQTNQFIISNCQRSCTCPNN